MREIELMLTLERQDEIIKILSENNSATVDELCEKLFVSGATIRRDLRAMEKQGLIKRSHGGAMIFKSSAEDSAFAIREQENTEAKRVIGLLASKLIKSGDSVFMDSSSTVGFVIPHLNAKTCVSVTTNGLRNALLLSKTNNVKVYVTGGLIENHSNSITGTDTMEFIYKINANVCLVSCSGVDLDAGFTDANIEQAKLKRQMRKNSNKIAVLCDSSKFGKKFMCKDFDFSEIDYLITDVIPPKEFIDKMQKNGVEIIIP